MTGLFRQTVPEQARASADRWVRMAPALASPFDRLRDDGLGKAERDRSMDDLYRRAVAVQRPLKPWRTVY